MNLEEFQALFESTWDNYENDPCLKEEIYNLCLIALGEL